MRRIITLTLAFAILLTTFSGCGFQQKSDDELIQARIDRFLSAYNSGDMDAVLKCLDTKTRNTFQSAMGLAEAFGGSLSGISGITVSDLFGFSVGTVSEGDILTVDIQQINITDETKATVDVTMFYNDEMQNFSDKAIFSMLKEDGDWYIKNFEEK